MQTSHTTFGRLARLALGVFVVAAPALATVQQDTARQLGIPLVANATARSHEVARAAAAAVANPASPVVTDSLGLPGAMPANAPHSAAIMTITGGRSTQHDTLGLLADWDGREDNFADHEGILHDFRDFLPPDVLLTRAAISNHTIANGWDENVYYDGDSLGNVFVAIDDDLDGETNQLFVINLPDSLNAFGSLSSDSQIVVTGLCVNPVADLTSFADVNGAYDEFDGQTGEILYVSYWDTGGGFRLGSNGVLVQSGLLAFPILHQTSPAADAPSPISDTGFPLTVGGAFGVLFSPFANVGGIACDDDGSVYFHQANLVTGYLGNIVKVTSVDNATWQDRSLATSGIITLSTLHPTGGNYGTTSGPANQINRITNYSGPAAFFGNVVALATGNGNSLYAAVSSSRTVNKKPTEGPFKNAAALGYTPSMIITFSDYRPPGGGQLPAADGFADVITPGATLSPGINNFRAFVLGDGPDRRGTLPVFGTKADTLKLGMQIDYTIHSGLTVDEAGTVYVISGGTPAGTGLNPSPDRGEILAFPDMARADRKADRLDLRANLLPMPPQSSAGPDGDSDRFDHIFWRAPIDQVSFKPTGIAGLTRGFLRYMQMQGPNTIDGLSTLLSDDDADGPIWFNDFDPSFVLAGGDDNYPFSTGDDQNGGFEFNFGGACTEPWTTFYLGSNGFVTFGAGDTQTSGSPTELATDPFGKVAAAWTDLLPNARTYSPKSFPLMALGFAGPNQFKVRWINVPRCCSGETEISNTFSISLFDDGQVADEGPGWPFDLEGSLAFRTTGAGPSMRYDTSGYISLEYGAMGLTSESVLAGFSVGSLGAAPAEVNLSSFSGLVGSGSTPMVYEYFDTDNYDLRFEGTNRNIASPSFQPNKSRERVDLRGAACHAPLF